jgi:GMP reductase
VKIEQDTKLDFDDVLIKPKRSESASRKEIILEREFHFKYSKQVKNVIPIISANMDTCGSIAMAKALHPFKCMVALHKFYDVDTLGKFFQTPESEYTFYSMGINDGDFQKFKTYRRFYGDPSMVLIDVSNGYTKYFVRFCEKIRDILPYSIIMAGNVCTAEGAQELAINGGVDIVKVGIGPGKVCTTRLVTGVGYSQLSAISETADVVHGVNGHICADGGISNSGDMAKAIGAGSDFQMIGGMLAGCDECEGTWLSDNFNPEGRIRKTHLKYHGMSSLEAMEKHSGGMADYKASEGIEIVVPYKGKAEDTIKQILGGLRSTCSFVGAKSLKDLPKCTTFIKVNRIK